MAQHNTSITFNVDFNTNNASKSMQNLSRQINQANQRSIASFNVLATAATAAFAAIKSSAMIQSATMSAMDVDSAINNLSFTLGENAQQFQDWVDNVSGAFGIATASAYKFGSTYTNLLSSFAGDSASTAAYSAKLMEQTAVIASKTGRSFEDVAERIRSGLLGNTEAIEDLGVYVNVSMIESTNAFKKFAGDSSWMQLDYQTQQQIRLMAILEQSYDRYGDVVANTVASKHGDLMTSLANVKLALGNAFMPIYESVLPGLIQLSNMLSAIIVKFGDFANRLFGLPKPSEKEYDFQSKSINKATDSMTDYGDETEETAKKVSKAMKNLQGFDKLNRLSKEDDGKEKDGAKIKLPDLDLDSSISTAKKAAEDAGKTTVKWVDDIISALGKLRDIAKPTTDALKELWRYGLKPLTGFIWQGLTDFYDKFLVPIGKWWLGDEQGLPRLIKLLKEDLASIDWQRINNSLSNLFENGLQPLAKFVWTGLVDFYEFFLGPISRWVIGEAFPRLVDLLANVLASIDYEKINNALITLWNALEPFARLIGEGLLWFLENVLGPLAVWATNNLIPAALELIAAAIGFLTTFVEAALPTLEWFWDKILKPIANFVGDAFILFIEILTKALNGLTKFMQENQVFMDLFFSVLLAALGYMVTLYVKHKIVIIIGLIKDAMFVFMAVLARGLSHISLTGVALFTLGAAIIYLSQNWSKLTPLQRFGSIFWGLAAAVSAAAIAIAVFHASWSVGLAAAAIAGGIVAVGIAYSSVLKNSSSQAGSAASSAAESAPKGVGTMSAKPTGAVETFKMLQGDPGLPKLAKGGLIPPRKERMVIVGDNQVEDEIVSPVSTMQSAFKDAAIELGLTGGSGGNMAGVESKLNQILNAIQQGSILVVNDRELGRVLAESNRDMKTRLGVPLK